MSAQKKLRERLLMRGYVGLHALLWEHLCAQEFYGNIKIVQLHLFKSLVRKPSMAL